MTPALVWLQAQPSIFNNPFVPMVLVFGIFYLLLIRPQQKQRKEHEAMLQSIGRGDEVVTTGGIHGRVTGAADEVLTVEIANLKGERVRIKVDRAHIERRTSQAAPADAS